MDVQTQQCGLCMHYRDVDGGTCLVYGGNVSADGHHVNLGNAITGEECGCEDFVTADEDEEWCMVLEKAERHPVPWR